MGKKDKEQENLRLVDIVLKSNLPIVTLDERWHNLLPEEVKTHRIKELEKQLNDLIKSQGRLGTDIADMRKLKKKLMDEVIQNMGESSGIAEKIKQKKQEKIQKLLYEINDKLDDAQKSLEDCPMGIRRANAELVAECVRVWYQKMDYNNQEIEEIDEWIEVIREKMKEKLLVRQDKENENAKMYSYMHALLGPKSMEYLDHMRKRKE